MAIIQRPTNDTGTILQIGGGLTSIFGLATGLFVLFVVPNACGFVGSIQLLISGFLFIIGLIAFSLGNVLVRKRRR